MPALEFPVDVSTYICVFMYAYVLFLFHLFGFIFLKLIPSKGVLNMNDSQLLCALLIKKIHIYIVYGFPQLVRLAIFLRNPLFPKQENHQLSEHMHLGMMDFSGFSDGKCVHYSHKTQFMFLGLLM